MDELSTNKRKALTAIISTPTIPAAAAACGLCQRTLYNYLRDPVFREALSARQGEITSAATAAAADLTGRALAVLGELLDDPLTPPAVRARVALGAPGIAQRLIEQNDLQERISRLEERIK